MKLCSCTSRSLAGMLILAMTMAAYADDSAGILSPSQKSAFATSPADAPFSAPWQFSLVEYTAASDDEPQRIDSGEDWLEEVSRLYDEPGERHGGGYGHRGPFIPEPMVFDLVRSLGAAVGEAEINSLAQFNGRYVAWAPEIEAVIWPNFAIEFELPFEDNQLEAYKFAVQHTLGVGWDDKFIHGWQGIAEYRRETSVTEATLVHIGGLRFDESWSTLWMLGGRAHIGGDTPEARADLIFNWSLFLDVTDKLVAGLEANYAQPLGAGRSDVLLMPQLHIDLSDNFQLQCGFGARFDGSTARGEAGMRAVWSF